MIAITLNSLIKHRSWPVLGWRLLRSGYISKQLLNKCFAANFSSQVNFSATNLLHHDSTAFSNSTLYNTLIYNENYEDRYLSDEELKSNKNFHCNDPFICLTELIKFKRPRSAYSVLRYYTNKDRLDRKSIYPAAKLLASVRFHGIEREDFVRIVEYLRLKLPNDDSDVFNSVRHTITFLLDACEENFKTLTTEQYVGKLLDTSDCFHLAGGIAINCRNWDALEQLCVRVAPYETFFSHNVFPIYDKLIALLTSQCDAATVDRVMRIFMNHLAGSEYYMSHVEFDEFVEPAFRLSKQWQWKEIRPVVSRSDDNKVLVTCEKCLSILKKQNTLTQREHATLLKSFEDSIEEGLRTERVASIREFAGMKKLVAKIRNEHSNSTSIPLVVDGLNALYANASNDGTSRKDAVVRQLSFTGLYNLVLKLLNRRYGPILVVHRRHFRSAEFVQKLRVINVYSFQCDRHSEDDTFMIYAALALGGQTQILTNDFFHDWRGMLSADSRELFNHWYNCRRIAYLNGHYEVPTVYKRCVQKSADGYHASVMGLISRNHWIKPRTICIQKLESV